MQGNENAVVVYPCSRLSGEIRLQGAKNSVLPVMAAALLNKGISVFKNCPEIADVYIMAELLKICGCKVVFEKHTMLVDASDAENGVLDSEYATDRKSVV